MQKVSGTAAPVTTFEAEYAQKGLIVSKDTRVLRPPLDTAARPVAEPGRSSRVY